MKKLICLFLAFAILLSCCACGQAQTTAVEATVPAATVDPSSPEGMFGHIDQTVPVDGVYKIWNEVGVKNMAAHPDASFEFLCDVDMKGAILSPIGTDAAPFTGTLNGGNFFIKNFTLQGGQEQSFGFVSVNKGQIFDLRLQDVTLIPGENVKNAGAFVGDNQGKLTRCYVTGTMTVTKAAEGASIGAALGRNSGSLENAGVTVDLLVDAPGAANVGGIVGTSTGGNVDYIDTEGKLDVTGNNKTVGLFAGSSTDTVFTKCAFIGASNTVDGKLFTNYTGNADDDELVVAVEACCRVNDVEPMPENIAKLRDTVVDRMYELGTIEWHVDKDLPHNCVCSLSACVGVYSSQYTYIGMPYKHGNASYMSFQYCLDDNGYMKDWLWAMDSYDTYIGTMCTTAAMLSLWTVCNSVEAICPQNWSPYYYPENNCIPIGEGWWEDVDNYNSGTGRTNMYVENRTEQKYFEDMALIHRGDILNQGIPAGTHTIMVASEPVIVRNQDGTINGAKSYVYTHEQNGRANVDDEKMTSTTFLLNKKQTFDALRAGWWTACTIEEFVTGEMETPECKILDGAEGRMGLTTGIVQANYYLDAVFVKITDSKGNVVMDHTFFTRAGKYQEVNAKLAGLAYVDSYDLANVGMMLQSVMFVPGQTYEYTISAHLMTGDEFVVKTDSFTQGGTK